MPTYQVTLTYKYQTAPLNLAIPTFTRCRNIDARDLDDLHTVIQDKFPAAHLIGPSCIRRID
jgi:hypothetical protein